MNAGEIHWVNLDPTVGNEIKKRRPVVVLNGGHQKNLRLSIVVPLTQWQEPWDNNPFFVTIAANPQNGLQKTSSVDCYQIRAISHDRFLGKIGQITPSQLDRIKTAIALVLDIDSGHCQ